MSSFSNSRRRFLFTAGTTVALPWLPSLVSVGLGSRAHAAEAGPGVRLLAYYVPCGIYMRYWEMYYEGRLRKLSRILAPLQDNDEGVDLRPWIEVLSGLRNDPARAIGNGEHASGTGAFLTCRQVNKSETRIRAGISMDQIYAQHIGRETSFASIQLGTEGGSNVGNCDSGYGCAYPRNISWASASQPLPKLTEPRAVFDLLFGGHDKSKTKAEIEERRSRRLSVLDSVLSQASSLSQRLSSQDRMKLDEFMSGIRSLELRIEKSGKSTCDIGDWSVEGDDYESRVDDLIDLSVLAMQCDATRVISFMHGNGGSTRSHGFLGIPESHHDLSHHRNERERLEKLRTLNIWELSKFSRLLAKMSKVQEGERTLLENSLVFFSSELSDGHAHNHDNLPVIVAGNAGGKLTTGRHRFFRDGRISELFMSMLDLLGAPVASFGDDGTKALEGFV